MERPLLDQDSDPVKLDLTGAKKRHHWIFSTAPDKGKTSFTEAME